MTKEPPRGTSKVVSNEMNARSDDERARFQAAEQRDFLATRLEESRMPPGQRVVDVARMDHQLRHPGPKRAQRGVETHPIEDDGVNAAEDGRSEEHTSE